MSAILDQRPEADSPDPTPFPPFSTRLLSVPSVRYSLPAAYDLRENIVQPGAGLGGCTYITNEFLTAFDGIEFSVSQPAIRICMIAQPELTEPFG